MDSNQEVGIFSVFLSCKFAVRATHSMHFRTAARRSHVFKTQFIRGIRTQTSGVNILRANQLHYKSNDGAFDLEYRCVRLSINFVLFP